MSPLVALGIVVLLDAAVVYIVADDVLNIASPLTYSQAAWLGLAVAVVPALVYVAL
jgi:hypothetical protein